jgi:glycosyltransferase involved in cell wall biosynthesis
MDTWAEIKFNLLQKKINMSKVGMQGNISVIIPLYNHFNYIEKAINSVLSQTVPISELIIVDDGSTDDSYNLVQNKYSSYKNIIFWSRDNIGAHNAINSGIYRATSEYIAILNSDDAYVDNRIEKCLNFLNKNKETQIVCSGIDFIDDFDNVIENKWYLDALSFYDQNKELDISLINANFLMTTSNVVARKSIFEKYGFFKKYRYAHDLEFFLRIIGSGEKIEILNDKLLNYRFHSNNTISEGVLKVKLELAAIVANYLSTYGKYIKPDGEINYKYLEKLYEVLDSHRLSRMLSPLILLASKTVNFENILINENFSKNMNFLIE